MGIVIRPLREDDLDAADRICRVAFGTFVGVPEPASFFGDADYVRSRWRAPTAAFAAEADGDVVGSNFVTTWGSFGFFGPLSVRPDLWDRGVAKRLLEPLDDVFARRGVTHAGLFTFAASPKHVGLYQRFGFWPRFLTFVMGKPIASPRGEPAWSRFSMLPAAERLACLAELRVLTSAIHDGLDLETEIRVADEAALGDTVLLPERAGFAVCHHGPGTEAGSGTCFVKFAAVRPGSGAGERFEDLVDACETLARTVGAERLVAGVNAAREDACRRLRARGFRTIIQGIAMQRPNEPGFNRPDVYVLDDWR